MLRVNWLESAHGKVIVEKIQDSFAIENQGTILRFHDTRNSNRTGYP